MLNELIGNRIFLAVVIAGLLAQALKVLICFLKNQKIDWQDLFVTGGMPSSHSAFVTALVTAILLVEGISTSLIISLVLAVLVMRDSLGIRRSVGEGGVLLDEIAKHLKMQPKIHYSLGHTPAQVLIGGFLGVVVALIVYFW